MGKDEKDKLAGAKKIGSVAVDEALEVLKLNKNPFEAAKRVKQEAEKLNKRKG